MATRERDQQAEQERLRQELERQQQERAQLQPQPLMGGGDDEMSSNPVIINKQP
jgi:hypothetical protein